MDRGNITSSYFRPLRSLQKDDPPQNGVSSWKWVGNGLKGTRCRLLRLFTHGLPRIYTVCIDATVRLREGPNQTRRSGGVVRYSGKMAVPSHMSRGHPPDTDSRRQA
jgi:hypothetical protein